MRLDGSNAVFAGKQTFYPTSAGTHTVQLAVFDMSVTVHDALFGRRIGSQLLVTRPNGRLYTVSLGSGPPATRVRSLVRGTYGLTVASAVLGGNTDVLVSRNDAVDLRVITLLDVIVSAIVVLLIIAATLAWGSRMSRRWEQKHRVDGSGAA